MRRLTIETGKDSQIIEAMKTTCEIRVDHKESIRSSSGASGAAFLMNGRTERRALTREETFSPLGWDYSGHSSRLLEYPIFSLNSCEYHRWGGICRDGKLG